MGRIIDIKNLSELKIDKEAEKQLVLAGGCFDILHAGHIRFLENAKGLGDVLVVLLESDRKIKQLKGEARPVNPQASRALNVLHVPEVDYVVLLPYLSTDQDYEHLVKTIQPDIIAVTNKDNVFLWEKEYEKTNNCRIMKAMDREEQYSTSKIVEGGEK